MVFDQYACGCQLLYHNCCCQDNPLWYLFKIFMSVSYLYHTCFCQDYPLWYLVKIFMAVSYNTITAAFRIILYGI